MKYSCYDIETYPNIFTFCALDPTGKKFVVFEISDRKDEREKLFSFIRKMRAAKIPLVGFNNEGFDYPVVHYLLTHKGVSVKSLYKKAMSIIEDRSENARFKHLIWDKEKLVPQIDLYKIHHFDNIARATSLKVLEFNMRSDNIEDLPFPVGLDLTDEEKDVLIKYNKHDVRMTYDFMLKSLDRMEFREELTRRFGSNHMNFNDTKIGKEYFIRRLEESNKGCCYDTSGQRKKVRQTRRKNIKFKECILPYVKFKTPEFNSVLDWLKGTTITETKESLNDLLERDIGGVAKYAHMKDKKVKLKLPKGEAPSDELIAELKAEDPTSVIQKVPLKSGDFSYWNTWRIAKNLNVVVGGFQFDFGTGGIHGSVEPQTVLADEEWLIVDVDVASYYPNLSIKNNLYPEHLGEDFCRVYEDVYNERKSHPKGSTENAMMKLALNGVYGASNDQYAPFYDPKFTMSITINGQLLLCMLSEDLLEIDGLKVIQINTDGVTFKVRRKDLDRCDNICRDWEKLTGLELERVDYSAMYIRDVNNYIAMYDGSDGVKRKGAYEYENLDWSKNHSSLIIKMAASHSLLHDGEIESFVRNHKNIHDFMLRIKVPRSCRVVTVDEFGMDCPEQNVCRYYASMNGGNLVKIMPPLDNAESKPYHVWRNPDNGDEVKLDKNKGVTLSKKKGYTEFIEIVHLPPQERRFDQESGVKVKVCNDINEFSDDIDYTYYIDAANKLVDEVKNIK